jgi:hypothetical protein
MSFRKLLKVCKKEIGWEVCNFMGKHVSKFTAPLAVI